MRFSGLAAVFFAFSALAAPKVTVLPERPLIEQSHGTQSLNFDLLVENDGTKRTIERIEMSVYAPDGTFVSQQRLQSNGGSIDTLPDRELAPDGRLVVFNPFHTFRADLAIGRLAYEFLFDDDSVARVDVQPRAFEQRTILEIPVEGRVFVHDGHDFLSHHRRLDITGMMTTKLGIRTNMTRFAYDFVTIDGEGKMRKGASDENSDWYCFGTPVAAPGDGVVLAAVSSESDNDKAHPWHPELEKILENVHRIGGNYVLIDHGNGEYSWLGHMKQGSVSVKAGDRVKRGQVIGAVGASGDALFPHLHYQLQSDHYLGEGLPPSFSNFQLVNGGKPQTITRGTVDTGDVLIVKRAAAHAGQ